MTNLAKPKPKARVNPCRGLQHIDENWCEEDDERQPSGIKSNARNRAADPNVINNCTAKKGQKKPRNRPEGYFEGCTMPGMLDDDLTDVPTLAECFAEEERPKKKRSRSSSSASTMNEASCKEFLSALRGDDKGKGKVRGTHIPKYALRIIDNSTDALVFSQLSYWLQKGGHKPHVNRGLNYRWVAKSATDLGRELHRPEDMMSKSLCRLRKQGFIAWENRKFGGVKQRHISIMWDKVHLAYKQVTSELSD